MRSFFLFYLLTSLFGSPWIALAVVAAVFYFGESRWSGRYFNPIAYFRERSAVAELTRQLDINPHDVGAHNDLGRILATEGRYTDALPHLEKAVARMDDAPEPHYFLGLCQIESGRGDEGSASIERALELNPSFRYGEPQVTLARHHHGEGRFAEAARHAETAVARNTSSVEGWYLLGAARAELGDAAGAGEAYAEAAKAYEHLPHYLRLANRKWARAARKAA